MKDNIVYFKDYYADMVGLQKDSISKYPADTTHTFEVCNGIFIVTDIQLQYAPYRLKIKTKFIDARTDNFTSKYTLRGFDKTLLEEEYKALEDFYLKYKNVMIIQSYSYEHYNFPERELVLWYISDLVDLIYMFDYKSCVMRLIGSNRSINLNHNIRYLYNWNRDTFFNLGDSK